MASQADVRKVDAEMAKTNPVKPPKSAVGSTPQEMTGPGQIAAPNTPVLGLPRTIALMEDAIAQALQIGSEPWPTYKAPDSTRLMDALKEFSGIADKALGLSREATEQGVAASKKAVEAVNEEVPLLKDQIDANQSRAQQLADNSKVFTDMFGVSPNSERIAQLAAEKQKLEDLAIQQKAEIAAEYSRDFMSDPLGWITSRITTPYKVDAHNRVVEQYNAVSSAIDSAIASATNAQQLSTTLTPAITARQAAAASRLVETGAKKASAAAEQDAAKFNIDMANRELSVAQASVSAESKIFETKFQTAMTEYNARVNALQRSEQQAQFRVNLASLVESLDDKKTILAHLRVAEQRLGVPPGTYSWTRYKMLPKEQQDNLIGVSVGAAGVNPVDALVTYQQLGVGETLDPKARRVLSTTAEFIGQVRGEQGYKMQTGKEAQEAYVRKRVDEEYSKFLKTPDSPDPRNPYKALPLQDLLAADPLVEATPAGIALKPLASQAAKPDTSMIIDTILTHYKGNTKRAASAISDYFKRNVIKRDELMQYSSLGLKAPGIPSYVINYTLPSGQFAGGVRMPVDLVQENQVEQLLLQIAKRRKLQEGGTFAPRTPAPTAPINPGSVPGAKDAPF